MNVASYYVSVTEIAKRVGLSRPTVYKFLNLNKISGGVKVFGQRRVKRAEFEAWLLKHDPDAPKVAPKKATGVPPPRSRALIYFIECQQGEKPIKIGHTTQENLEVRMMKLRCASPYPLRLLGTIEGGQLDEKRLHRKFKSDRLSGEWFRPSENIRKFLKAQGV